MGNPRVMARLLGLVCGAALLGGASPGLAATHTQVDCGAGADLQAALDAAPKGAILEISGTCEGLFTIQKQITLNGVSGAVLDGQHFGTTLTVSAGSVRLIHLTVTGGEDMTTAENGDQRAGGIRNAGSLTLVHVTVIQNGALSSGVGINNSGSLTVDHSLITQNDGIDEGGILSFGGSVIVKQTTISDNDGTGITIWSGTLRVTDSTVSGNRSAPQAGGVFVGGGSATIIRSTIANNVSTDSSPGAIAGGPVRIVESTITGNDAAEGTGGVEGVMTLTATILAGNTVGGSSLDCSGTITSKGYNLIGTTTDPDPNGADPPCIYKAKPTDQVGTTPSIDPLLTPLGKHGGPTQTALPRPASPVIDAIPVGALASDGVTALCPASGTTDQRGVARPRGPACDIGSVER